MLDKFIFENHLGLRFDGLANGVYLNYNDLRDYSWSYESINSRISRFFRSITKRKIPLVVFCKSEDEAVAVKNRLHELAEADIVAKLPGKIYVGEFYTLGYITASTKSKYLINKRCCNIDLTLTSDNPAWYTEKTFTFLPGSAAITATGSATDYPYDYPYDYAQVATGKQIALDTICANAFKLKIYGKAINPAIVIGGHKYAIDGTIGDGETLLIDGQKKTITLTRASGATANWYDKRNRGSYIFEPIPPGQINITWDNSFGFDLTVIEERSEPKWT